MNYTCIEVRRTYQKAPSDSYCYEGGRYRYSLCLTAPLSLKTAPPAREPKAHMDGNEECDPDEHNSYVQPLASAPPATASSSPRFRTFPREPIQTRSTTRRLQQMEQDLSSVAVSKFHIISDGSSNAAMQAMQLVAHKKWSDLSDDSDPG